MQIIWKWFTGVIFAITLLDFTMGCKVSDINGKFTANCSNEDISEVPQSLSSKIEVLDLSGDLPIKLLPNSFEKYKELKELFIRHVKTNGNGTKTDPSAFTSLTKLKIIDLEEAGYDCFFNWPPNIQIMNVNNNGIKSLNVINLNKLRSLSAERNNLMDVPEIHKLAPLTELRVRQNQFDDLIVETIAEYCLLTTLELSLNQDSELKKPKRYCQCSRVKKWLENLNVTANVTLECTSPGDVNCIFEFNEATDIREKCLKRHTEMGLLYIIEDGLEYWSWRIAVTVLFVLMVFIVFGFMVYRKLGALERKSPSVSAYSESENRTYLEDEDDDDD